ncbi:MAG: hypothetical protein AB1898_31565 [Acidobacteriota bacterium]
MHTRPDSRGRRGGGVYFEVGGNRQALPDATVEVAPYGYKKPPLAAVVTKQDGRFSLAQIRPGRYYLSVRHASIIGLSVEMRVTRPKRTKDGAGEIEIVLRNDPSKYCAGGTVTVVRRTGSRSAQSAQLIQVGTGVEGSAIWVRRVAQTLQYDVCDSSSLLLKSQRYFERLFFDNRLRPHRQSRGRGRGLFSERSRKNRTCGHRR